MQCVHFFPISESSTRTRTDLFLVSTTGMTQRHRNTEFFFFEQNPMPEPRVLFQ
jgi:hypothetical protein